MPVKKAPPPSTKSRQPGSATYVVLTGNPNCGKTTIFNALTGLRAKVGNYAGVTVERKEGPFIGAPPSPRIRVLDLPGTYSLCPQSLDEQISRDVLLNRLPELPAPSVIVVVVDASNLQRNLYYATQVIELGLPTIIALNMVDVAASNGQHVDAAHLSSQLGAAVVPVVASAGEGIPQLRQAILQATEQRQQPAPRRFCNLPPQMAVETEALALHLADTLKEPLPRANASALLILSQDKALTSSSKHFPVEILAKVAASRTRLEKAGVDWRSAAIEGRYDCVAAIESAVLTQSSSSGETFSDRLDRVLTHKIWGTAIFLLTMVLIFQSIFTFARLPMSLIQSCVDWSGRTVGALLPPGDLNSLLVDGVIAGVGAVVVFLPQILLLFLFIGFLEDTGYMARAAFLMDRLMSKVGLHGKSFIPMLSSFACAIPGIMSARTIESPKDRLVTILVCPLMSCSARLPVYTVLIAACIPNITLLGFLKLPGLTMLCMYSLGIFAALGMAWIFKKTLLKSEPPLLIMELPPYKMPLAKVVFHHMWDRARIFLRQAGTVILAINIILWCLATYPRSSHIHPQYEAQRAAVNAREAAGELAPDAASSSIAELNAREAGDKLRNSFAGKLGRAIEPILRPLGFDWKIGIGIISSFAAREVFVSTMSTVYNVGAPAGRSGTEGIVQTLKNQKSADGSALYTPLLALTLMVFYVFALQCASTVAIVKRETNSWRWPAFQWIYLGALAWTFAYLTRSLGHWFGFA